MYKVLSMRWDGASTQLRVAGVIVILCMSFFNVMIAVDGHQVTYKRIVIACKGGEKKKK